MLHSMNLVAFAYDISCIFRDVSLILCAVPKRNTNRFCSQILFKGSIIFLLSLFSSLFHSLHTNSWQNGINRHTIINMNMIRFFPFRHRKMLWIMICWQKTIHLLPKSSANSIELWTNFFFCIRNITARKNQPHRCQTTHNLPLHWTYERDERQKKLEFMPCNVHVKSNASPMWWALIEWNLKQTNNNEIIIKKNETEHVEVVISVT